jgi:hypothetical protein
MFFGSGRYAQELVAAGGIRLLVEIATTGWPADACVVNSGHLYVQVIDAEVCLDGHTVLLEGSTEGVAFAMCTHKYAQGMQAAQQPNTAVASHTASLFST